MISRSKVFPSGSTNSPSTRRRNDVVSSSRSPTWRKPVSGGGIESDLEQVRVARPCPVDRSGDELPEQRVWPIRASLEFWVRLRPDEIRVTRQLDELDEAVVGGRPTQSHPGGF